MTVKFYKIINKIAMINSNGYYQSLSLSVVQFCKFIKGPFGSAGFGWIDDPLDLINPMD